MLKVGGAAYGSEAVYNILERMIPIKYGGQWRYVQRFGGGTRRKEATIDIKA
jgi:hypothetical protein